MNNNNPNHNSKIASAQSILHNVLYAIEGRKYFQAVLSYRELIGPLKIRMTRTPDVIRLSLMIEGEEVLSLNALRCDDKVISFIGIRYATPNKYGYRVEDVNVFRRGEWVNRLKEYKKPKPESSPGFFDPIDDAHLWEEKE